MEENGSPHLCVCGAGTMGSGIGQAAAAAGLITLVYDVAEERLSAANRKIASDLEKLVAKQKLTEDEQAALLRRLLFTTDIRKCTAPVIIEAVIENMAEKVTLLQGLAAVNGPDTILASNTSSLSLAEMARQLPHPERVAGMHFFNPAPLMKLVEVVSTEYTAPQVVQQLTDLAVRMGKTPVLCTDAPGFIVNRVARPYYLEALRLAEEGIAGMETIDRVLEATGFKMGPFRLMDLIGNDINYAVSCSVYDRLNRPERLRPSGLQQEKVAKGELGRKTGRGYYRYE